MTFGDLAQRAFRFLLNDGFAVVDSTEQWARFERDGITVTVSWDSYTGEAAVGVSRQLDSGSTASVGLGTILSMLDVDRRAVPAHFSFHDLDRALPLLEALAETTRMYAGGALAGEPVFFEDDTEHLRGDQASSAREFKLRQAQRRGQVAWDANNLQAVVYWYGAVEEDLTATERTRLAYARKHEHD